MQKPRKAVATSVQSSGFFFGDKADVAAALDAGSLHPTDILAVEAQTQVFLDVMGGNMIAHHLFPDEFAVFDNEVGAAFDQNAKCMGVIGHQREQAVKLVFKPTDGGPPLPMFTPA